MKVKFLIFLMVNFFSLSLCAADMIVTKDSKKIDAKVLEVSSSEIKYKKKSNLNGPTYVISTSEIQTIIYENGEVEIYEERKDEVVEGPSSKVKNDNVVSEVKSEEKSVDSSDSGYNTEQSQEILKTSGDSLGYRSLNGKRMTSYEYSEYLKAHCKPASKTYQKGNGMLGAGIGMIIMGELTGIIGFASDCAPVAVVGSFIEIVGIPLVVTGAKKKRKSIKVYEEKCLNNDTAFEYRIGYTGKGLGLALNF